MGFFRKAVRDATGQFSDRIESPINALLKMPAAPHNEPLQMDETADEAVPKTPPKPALGRRAACAVWRRPRYARRRLLARLAAER